MGIYWGPAPAGISGALIAFCFSGRAAIIARYAIPAGGVVSGGIIGGFVGLAASLFTGPEVVTKPLAAIVFGIVGAFVGFVAAEMAIKRGACPCPTGKQAFCICIPPPVGCVAACTLVPTG